MADTLPNIIIPANTWTNLYGRPGVTVGNIIAIQNTGSVNIYLAVQRLQPDNGHDSYGVLHRHTGNWMRNEEGDLGAWAYAPNTNGKLSIKVL